MGKRKGLIEEFWESAELPDVRHQAIKEFFDELNEFIDPRTYVGEGILKSVVKIFTEFLK